VLCVIREKYEGGLFQLQYIGTEDQIADILIKLLVKDRFEKCRLAIGVTTIKEIINLGRVLKYTINISMHTL
jgi:hypothetical protein